MADEPTNYRQPYGEGQRLGESPQEHRWRDLRERLDDMKRDLRERIDEVKKAVTSDIGEIKKDIGRLQEGKADVKSVEELNKNKASKLAELAIFGLIILIVAYVVNLWLGVVVIKPSAGAPEPMATAAPGP